jgi:hypothetical protein
MSTRISFALLACVLAGAAPLKSQEPPATGAAAVPIATDRPSVTDSNIVVPAGTLQVESGFLGNSTGALRTLDAPATLIRFGLLSRTELRLDVPDHYWNQSIGPNPGVAPGSGIGDLAVGVKQQLPPGPGGLDASVVASVSFPTGAQAVSSHGYDPSLQVPWARALSPKWTLAGMLSLYWPTQDGRRNLTGEPTILLDRQLTGRWGAFAECAGDFYQRGGPRDLLHVGTTFDVSKDQQLDFHAGVGSWAGTTFHFIGFGYSFRIRTARH